MKEEAFRTSAGNALNVAAAPAGRVPVVCLHGVTRRWQDWLIVAPYLAGRWRAVAVDLRGHGRSDGTPGSYRIADYVPDVIDFLRRGLSEPAIVIGHSLGGNVAAAVAAEAPDLVRGLVLEDPPLAMAGPRLAETGFPALFRVFLRHAGSDRPVAAIAAELAEARVPAPGGQGTVRLGDVRDAVSLRFSAYGLKSLDPEVLEVALAGRWLERREPAEDLRRIACPTLLIQADPALGGILPDDLAAEAKSLIRDAVHVRLTGIGHNIHSTAAEAMMRFVVPFLASLD